MRITIAAVGRLRAGPKLDLFNDYLHRLTWPHRVLEVEEKRRLDARTLKQKEGSLLLQSLPPGAVALALDGRGKALSSEAFAAMIQNYRESGCAELAFLIGGADGLSEEVRQTAARIISLGAMTWPHLFVRIMLAEQLYRAQAILKGHPYHRA